MEQGRPNSAFIHLGNGARKAIAAGLHKDVPSQDGEASESIRERRTTFWYLYFYETCSHTLLVYQRKDTADTKPVGYASIWGDQVHCC